MALTFNSDNPRKLILRDNYYYNDSLRVLDSFGGPSVYFHIEAIKSFGENFLSDRHIEMTYATLASWGMHRMGEAKAKLVNYDAFKKSILNNEEYLSTNKYLKWQDMNKDEYLEFLRGLKPVFQKLKVSSSNATLVANSKALHHFLPHMIPPIDRQYTVRFFKDTPTNFFNKKGGYKTITLPKGMDSHFQWFVDICYQMKKIFEQTKWSEFKLDDNSFNTSYPKIMDNLIMAYVKSFPKPNTKG
jgi:hypothetical protein